MLSSSITAIFLTFASAVLATSAQNAVLGGSGELSKRHEVACGNDYYCLAGSYCIDGQDGIPACCKNGETCTGDGGVSTIYQTAFVTVIHTSTLGHTEPHPTTTTTILSNPQRTNNTRTISASNPILTLTTTFPPRQNGTTTTTLSHTQTGNGTGPTISPPVIPPPSNNAPGVQAMGAVAVLLAGVAGIAALL